MVEETDVALGEGGQKFTTKRSEEEVATVRPGIGRLHFAAEGNYSAVVIHHGMEADERRITR